MGTRRDNRKKSLTQYTYVYYKRVYIKKEFILYLKSAIAQNVASFKNINKF